MIYFEKEVILHLGLPSIPKKQWDGKAAFTRGVAVVAMVAGDEAYALCRFDPERGDKEPVVTRVFGIEPFTGINRVYVVPNYMATTDDVEKMDLDDESKKKAMEILKEAEDIENESAEEKQEADEMGKLPEWVFPEITDREEAEAWLRRYNATNRIKGKIPKSEETLKLRLLAIYSGTRNNKKKR